MCTLYTHNCSQSKYSLVVFLNDKATKPVKMSLKVWKFNQDDGFNFTSGGPFIHVRNTREKIQFTRNKASNRLIFHRLFRMQFGCCLTIEFRSSIDQNSVGRRNLIHLPRSTRKCSSHPFCNHLWRCEKNSPVN